MAFEQGRKKTGGRKPSTPNKRTDQLLEILAQHGYNAVAELVELAQIAKAEYKRYDEVLAALLADGIASGRKPLDPAEAHQWVKLGIQSALGILPFIYPKRKPMEGQAEITPEQAEDMSTDELVAHAEKYIHEMKRVKQ